MDDGIVVAVRVTPRSSREVLAPGTADHFVARLAAPPVDGAANAALIALVARTFGRPKGQVVLLAGHNSRLKRLHIAGDATLLAKTAAGLYEAAP